MEGILIVLLHVMGLVKAVVNFSSYTDVTGLVIANVLLYVVAFFLARITEPVRDESEIPWKISFYNHLFRRTENLGLLIGTFLVPFVVLQQFGLYVFETTKLEITNYHYVIYLVLPILLSICTLVTFMLYTNMVQWGKHLIVYSLLLLGCLCVIPNCLERGTLVLCFLVCFIYIGFSQLFPRIWPHSFTFGELSIVCKGLAMLSLYTFLLTTNNLEKNRPAKMIKDVTLDLTMVLLASTVLVSFILTPIFYCLLFCCSTYRDRIVYSVCFYVGGVLNVGCVFLPAVQATTKIHAVIWVYRFIVSSTTIQICIVYCAGLVLLSLFVVYWHTNHNSVILKKDKNAIETIIVRKAFHFVAVAIFLPSICWTPNFISFASGVAVVLFVVAEYTRMFNVWPLGELIDMYLKGFKDDRDDGIPILTHLYLLLGCCVPIWIFPQETLLKISPNVLAIYSGVISLGIGDAIASLVGRKFGTMTWPWGRKTIVGSIAAMLSMLIFNLLILYIHNITLTTGILFKIVLVVGIATMEEAVTDQIDNVVLPLVMYGSILMLFS